MEKKWWPYGLATESVFFLFLWAVHPYTAWLMTMVLSPLFLSIFVVAKIAEWLEKSNVDRSFFTFMVLLGIIPLVWALLFCWLDDFQFSWLTE
ncbi:MAG: hypothetical protein IPL63_03105 [Saprospiraceae bacterium]|nr:hypothetical protein [Saprospiraceae bacterium]MBK6566732.1 hypothetical protein [Saprospiraceae bacterium]MBK7522932.1 hypothetical protein [Saprospiraceae bacterium]MBK8370690.1 hypothetical protein [Saprospiraceae bacterium]MBK8546397.1 hypothetical protein [Saprospiraceae bacterium]